MKHLHHVLPAAALFLCVACGDKTPSSAGTAEQQSASPSASAPAEDLQKPKTEASQDVAPKVDASPAAASSASGAPPAASPQEAKVLAPFVFHPALPQNEVMKVNGTSVPASRLLELVLEENFSTGISNIVMAKLLELELLRSNVSLSEADVEEELATMLSTAAPGKSLAEIEADGKLSVKHLRSQARTNRGWKKLYWESQNVPADQRTDQTNQLVMQFFVRQSLEKYERRIRGTAPEPLAGSAAQIIDRNNNNELLIGASETLDFLMGLVRSGALLEGAKELANHIALEQELAKAGKSIGSGEPAAWTAAKRVEYPPPFSWDQICRMRGTTPEREQERWWRVQAWKRSTGKELTDAEIETFLNAHKDFFMGKTKRAAHILVKTKDDVTGLPLDAAGLAAAEERIKIIQRKLDEGTDFGWLAENYSDDSVTAKGQGRIGQQFKEWGGALDPDFLKAAWALETVGATTGPVRSQFGWHIIRLDEITPPAAKQEPNWKEKTFWNSIREEAETFAMKAWMDSVLQQTKVELASPEVMFELKKHSYFEAPVTPGR